MLSIEQDVVHEDFSPVKKEEEIFTLLFKECNINNTGFANIDSLVNYIQQMLPDSPQKGEDIYDSDESVSHCCTIFLQYCILGP